MPDEHRGAAFVCAAALVLPGGERARGARHDDRAGCCGRRAATGGFGYDPIFIAEGETRTNAELDPAEKDAISHRGKAFRALAAVIAKSLPPPTTPAAPS